MNSATTGPRVIQPWGGARDAGSEIEPGVRLSIFLPEEMKLWARVEAAKRSQSMSAFIRSLIEKEQDRVR